MLVESEKAPATSAARRTWPESATEPLEFICAITARPELLERLSRLGSATPVEYWSAKAGRSQMIYCDTDPDVVTAKCSKVCVTVRGFAQLMGCVAHFILDGYWRDGQIPVDRLVGSFVALILDARTGTITVYRNLIGVGNVFYHAQGNEVHLSSNLATLTDCCELRVVPNQSVLPTYFLFRYVPGRDTLCSGVNRLMPGECLHASATDLRVSQLTTFAAYRQSGRRQGDPVTNIESALVSIAARYRRQSTRTGVLLSGGVDSSYLQAHWNRITTSRRSFCAVVDHQATHDDAEYASTAARALETELTVVRNGEDICRQFTETIALTGEPLNHVFAIYFPDLARTMVSQGVDVGVCGEAADGLYGNATANYIHNALLLRWFAPSTRLRRFGYALLCKTPFARLAYYFKLANEVDNLEWLDHPINQQAAFCDWSAVVACFGQAAVQDALAARRSLVAKYDVGSSLLEQLHGASLLTDGMNSASYWATLFNTQGAHLIFPFLDSTLLRVAVNTPSRQRFPFRKPKALLKSALERHLPREFARRKKLGFGQPIFEWLGERGPLRPLVDAIGEYEFVDPSALDEARRCPNWFLYSLLCYDIWYKSFVTCELPRARRSR
jgi:asparagine synthase (glutamine-hydrolysing)